MVSLAHDAINALRRAYAERPEDIDLVSFLQHFRSLSDDELADIIELDARERLRAGLSVDLSRYTRAIPDLAARCVALDAAIEFSIRSLVAAGHTTDEAVRLLSEQYPDLVDAISAACFLNDALGSTGGSAAAHRQTLQIQLPSFIGPTLTTGKQRYELRQRIGLGSHGAVFLAADHALSDMDRPAWVAVKIVSVDEQSPAVAARVVEEATKARRVTHPNIARVLDRGALPGGLEFVVYEHADGGDLQEAIDRGRVPMDPRSIAALTAKIARAVQAAHSAGLIHADLKPSNVLLSERGEPKIADFGLATRRFELIDADPGTPMGTLGFIAPEKYRAEPGSEGIPSDVYSLGAILFYLLAGRPPNGQTPDEIASYLDPASEMPIPKLVMRSGEPVDPDLEAICRRALAKPMGDRYASADALANDLEAFLAYRPLAWRRITPWRAAWLMAKRRPVATVTTAGACVTAMALVVASLVASRAAQATELGRQMDAVRAAEDARDRAIYQSTKNIVSMSNLLQSQSSQIDTQWLTTLTVMESVYAPLLFKNSDDRAELTPMWSSRIQFAQRRALTLEAKGGPNDMGSFIWKTGQAFWLLAADQFGPSRELLDEMIRRWSDKLGPTDTFLVTCKRLRACAMIGEILHKGSTISDTDRDALNRAHDELALALTDFKSEDHGSALHREILRALCNVTGESGLRLMERHRDYLNMREHILTR